MRRCLLRLPNNWVPRPYQRPLWDYLECGGRYAIAIWHRRAGKDEVALHRTAVAAMTRGGTYWHMLPEASQARKAIWEAVNPHTGKRRIDEAFPAEIVETRREQEMFIRFVNGSTWQVVGSDNFNSLVGSPPIGVVASEWALANPAAYAYMSPILRENGGWFLAITTPRGKNHAYRMLVDARRDYYNWFTEVLPATDTTVFDADQLDAERRSLIGIYGDDQGAALFEQEYMCSFDAAILGAYYSAEMARADIEGRIGVVDIDPAYPVHTAWDLGVGANLAIWFWQAVGREIRIVDYYQDNDGSIEAAAAVVLAKGYRRGTDWVPHDAKAKEISTGRTRVETMIRAGLKPRLVADHKVDDGINAARQTITRCHFAADLCHDGIEALRAYRREWDEAKRTFKPTPLHDWASHPADAFRYLSMAWREVNYVPPPQPGRIIAVGAMNQATMNDLWRQRPARHQPRL